MADTIFLSSNETLRAQIKHRYLNSSYSYITDFSFYREKLCYRKTLAMYNA